MEVCTALSVQNATREVCVPCLLTCYKLTSRSLYTPALPTGRFNWIRSLWAIPDTFVLTHQSLDAYLFLRFLKLITIACVVGCVITWPVLFPVNATGGGGQQQLNILSMSNVENPWRFWAHAGCAWLYFGKASSYRLEMIPLTMSRLYHVSHHP